MSKAAVSIINGFYTVSENVSIQSVLESIKSDEFKSKVESLRATLKLEGKPAYKKAKKSLLAFTPSGTFNPTRSEINLEAYNQYIIIDFDNIKDKEQLQHSVERANDSVYTYASFITPSDEGFKILVKTDTSAENHKVAFEQVSKYYGELLNLKVDPSGKDVCRLCFFSYDPNLYQNINSEIFKINLKMKTKSEVNYVYTETKTENKTKVEAYLQLIEEFQTDITEVYQDWVNIGFALADEFGEEGRDYYQTLSQFHDNYSEAECNKQFSECLRSKRGEITIASFYYIAHQYNIRLENEIEAPNKLPNFPSSLVPKLPKFLQRVLENARSEIENDIFLLSSLTSISACLENVVGIYDGHKIYSNLYLFITGKASSGKGKIKYAKEIVNPVHQLLRTESKKAKESYQKDLKEFDKEKILEKPKAPIEKMLFLPANNSSSGMFQLLENNEGKGLIFETEADTLTGTFKQDYGDYSDGFRKAFQHETISYYRKTDSEYVEIKKPKLSTVLTGTPKQVFSLFPNAENGLFSRFMFYKMEAKTQWIDVFSSSANKNSEDDFKELGEEFLTYYKDLKLKEEILFSLTVEQRRNFNQFFKELQKENLINKEEDYVATIRRLGLIAFRLMMILTCIRRAENKTITSEMKCENDDFNSALEMVKVLIIHANAIHDKLPQTLQMSKARRKKNFLKLLPKNFDRNIYIKVANSLDIKYKTAEAYITEFIKEGYLSRPEHGKYLNLSKL
ncbi:DUF3987 domain-containing protein [Mesonia aestuariivivens]|uniref:DUF3987 domain-containing protein n=1 Tax=Mesonia aestuariivivens TaxID=2796128 RepID=A0ABS6VXV3_9FLAO|nr:DUF3987 domain-containing protein [Mesonia aestuariivivens]MBW2960417.1 DUF3987 domain-containing protein [Mesonia aestuariivivens]